tara:strand:+ start:207 stop:917 length:711 start_codon:yes stop_codon:yes gene_type:complete
MLIKIKRLLYLTLGLIIEFIKKKDETISDKVIFLGKGESKKFFFENINKFNEIKDVVIINYERKDLKNINFYKNKRVHVVMNTTEPVLSFLQIIKIKIGKVYITRFKKNASDIKTSSIYKKKINRGCIYGKVDFFSDLKLIPFHDNQMGSGLVSLIYFVKKFNLKEVYLFGFDFYQDKLDNRLDFKLANIAKQHVESGKNNIKLFKKFLDISPQTMFFFPKITKIFIESKNFKIIE